MSGKFSLVEGKEGAADGKGGLVKYDTVSHLTPNRVLSDDRTVLKTETRFLLQIEGISVYEIARRILKLREGCDHGEWQKTVDELGLNIRSAQRYLQIGRRLSRSTSVAGLLPDRIRACLDLTDEDLKEIQEEETLHGQNLDEVGRMSRQKLEQLARKQRKTIYDGTQQLNHLKEENQGLRAQLEGEPRDKLERLQTRAFIALKGIGGLSATLLADLPDDAEREAWRRDRGWEIYLQLQGAMDALRPVIIDEERLTH